MEWISGWDAFPITVPLLVFSYRNNLDMIIPECYNSTRARIQTHLLSVADGKVPVESQKLGRHFSIPAASFAAQLCAINFAIGVIM